MSEHPPTQSRAIAPSQAIALSRITALLACGPGQPDGDIRQGLELTLGLTRDGRIDPDAYQLDPNDWPARRFRPDRPDWRGVLVREDGDWTLRGEPTTDGPLWLLGVRTLHPGDHITLRRPDGEELVLRVVGVAPVESKVGALPRTPPKGEEWGA